MNKKKILYIYLAVYIVGVIALSIGSEDTAPIPVYQAIFASIPASAVIVEWDMVYTMPLIIIESKKSAFYKRENRQKKKEKEKQNKKEKNELQMQKSFLVQHVVLQ